MARARYRLGGRGVLRGIEYRGQCRDGVPYPAVYLPALLCFGVRGRLVLGLLFFVFLYSLYELSPRLAGRSPSSGYNIGEAASSIDLLLVQKSPPGVPFEAALLPTVGILYSLRGANGSGPNFPFPLMMCCQVRGHRPSFCGIHTSDETKRLGLVKECVICSVRPNHRMR